LGAICFADLVLPFLRFFFFPPSQVFLVISNPNFFYFSTLQLFHKLM
jgi:hypothetical protein